MRKVTYFGDQRSRCFQFQLVVFVGLLEDGDFGVLFAANTFACADQYVNGIHFMNSEIAFLVLFALGLIWILDDGFLAIDFGLFQLMTEHTFDWFAFEFAGNLLDRLGNCVVLWMWIVSWDAAQWNAFFFLLSTRSSLLKGTLTPVPGLSSRNAAWLAQYVAKITSAARPLTFSVASALATTVCAATAIKPSICAPKSTFTTSPAFST